MKTFESFREGTLSYYFTHNEGFLSPSEGQIKSTPIHMTSSSNFTKRSAGNDHTHHGSSSANGQWRPLLLDADESGTPLSWLSTLFSRRKKQQKPRSGHACHDESKCEPFSPATLDWEPPRASSWEQLSSWEKPSSSSLWNHIFTEPHDADIQQLRPAIAVRVAPELEASMQKQESSRKGKLHWMKSLIAINWGLKLQRRIRKKRVAEQGGEDDDRESTTMSATPSSARGLEFLQNGLQNEEITRGQERVFHSQRELGATWSSHYSPLLHAGYASVKHKSRRSCDKRGDNGLLRFYLTPTRGFKIGRKRPRTHHPLIPEI